MSRLAGGQGSMNLHGTQGGDRTEWGLLKDRQGAEALQAFRGKLPERYRSLLEEYYRGIDGRLAGSPDGPPPPPPAEGGRP